MIALLDHRDSFTYNLVQALAGLGADVRVLAAAEVRARDVLGLSPTGILLGPGPGGPREAATALELALAEGAPPLLGVCLGHQVIAKAFGARVEPGPRPVHGHPVRVHHDGLGVFRGLPQPATMGRYHSLAVVEHSLGPHLVVSARGEDGSVQGLRHTERAIEGVQFHPESVLAEDGLPLLRNFLQIAGEIGP